MKQNSHVYFLYLKKIWSTNYYSLVAEIYQMFGEWRLSLQGFFKDI